MNLQKTKARKQGVSKAVQEQRRAQLVVADPGFRYAFLMHSILAHCYGDNKAERLRQYELAGIGKALAGAERRAGRALVEVSRGTK